ncbi:hypothetical protein R6Q59_032380 [Mikania micrantha]|uniref:Uncharacterized protein n=1 Tax=Mikania micrantha TaxID=192012 RepID=A0A5N6LDK0_9ASTR|nr:hypothetical protein E3N88_43915 [Mikania micrantha]
MKKPALFAASMAAASATTVISGSNFKSQSSLQASSNSSPEKTDCCLEKFAPRFDGLRFIETLVTAHR